MACPSIDSSFVDAQQTAQSQANKFCCMDSCVSIPVTTSPRLGCNTSMDIFFFILYYDQQMHNYFTNYHTPTLYYQQLHLKYLCNLVRY